MEKTSTLTDMPTLNDGTAGGNTVLWMTLKHFGFSWLIILAPKHQNPANQVRYGQRWFLGAQVYWTLIKRQMRVVLADKAAQASANRINTYANLYVQTPLKNAGEKTILLCSF